MEQRLSCSSSASGGEVNHEDEYHDDGLPDLVLAAGKLSTADQDTEDTDDDDDENSVVDLILSLTEGGEKSDVLSSRSGLLHTYFVCFFTNDGVFELGIPSRGGS